MPYASIEYQMTRTVLQVEMFVVYIGLNQIPLITKNNDLNQYKNILYTEICPEFKDTYVEEVYNLITSKYKLGRVRFLMKPPRSCLSWHRDPEMRLHIPIITNEGCRMVIEDTSFHMPSNGNGYITDNTKYHNFFNGSEFDRVHLVATVLEHNCQMDWIDEVKYVDC
jgi:hypothetical protein